MSGRPPGRAGRRCSATRPTWRSWRSGPTCASCAASSRRLQAAGLDVVDSYVSLTEVSEYAKGMPERDARGPRCTRSCRRRASRRSASTRCRSAARSQQNWYTLPYDERDELMREHGTSGRTFAGRVLQVDHRLDRPRRLRVGRHAVRRPPRRPEGGRLHDALRPGLGHLRRVRAASTPAWSRRSRSWSPAADVATLAASVGLSALSDRQLALGRRPGRRRRTRNRS